MEELSVRDILGLMIDRFETKGWIQHASCVSEPGPGGQPVITRACLQGACGLVVEDLTLQDQLNWASLYSRAGFLLAAAIGELFPERVQSTYWSAVIEFNDHDDTTFEDVMLVVKHAREAA